MNDKDFKDFCNNFKDFCDDFKNFRDDFKNLLKGLPFALVVYGILMLFFVKLIF